MAIAVEWVSRILAVGLVMVVPAVVGLWLDGRWGTKFLVLVGLALGMVLGMWYLLLLTRVIAGTDRSGDKGAGHGQGTNKQGGKQ